MRRTEIEAVRRLRNRTPARQYRRARQPPPPRRNSRNDLRGLLPCEGTRKRATSRVDVDRQQTWQVTAGSARRVRRADAPWGDMPNRASKGSSVRGVSTVRHSLVVALVARTLRLRPARCSHARSREIAPPSGRPAAGADGGRRSAAAEHRHLPVQCRFALGRDPVLVTATTTTTIDELARGA